MNKIFKENDKYKLLYGDVLDCLKTIETNSVDLIFTSPRIT